MKKFAIIILALALVLSLSVPVFAADNERQTKVSFSYTPPAPSYTVSIPATIELELDEYVSLDVTVSDIENLGNKKIAITLDDALTGDVSWCPDNVYHDFLIVSNPGVAGDYYTTLGYEFSSAQTGNSGSRLWHATLLEFEYDDTLSFDIWLYTDADVYNVDTSRIFPNSPYTGWITFGIKVVDAD